MDFHSVRCYYKDGLQCNQPWYSMRTNLRLLTPSHTLMKLKGSLYCAAICAVPLYDRENVVCMRRCPSRALNRPVRERLHLSRCDALIASVTQRTTQNCKSQADNSPMVGRPMGEARQSNPRELQLGGGDSIALLVCLERLICSVRRFTTHIATPKCCRISLASKRTVFPLRRWSKTNI